MELPPQIQEILHVMYFGNTVLQYASALGIFIVLILAFGCFKFLILRRLQKAAKRTKNKLDDTLVAVVQTLKPFFYAYVSLYIALSTLTIPDWLQKILYIILVIWIVYRVIGGARAVVEEIFRQKVEEKTSTKAVIGMINFVVLVVLWSIGILLILSNFGINITSLVAGLGIGGIAVALAVQQVLGDFISYISIRLDKPFIEGDFIVVGEKKGTIKKIGVKTTRLQAPSGEELIISNNQLTTSTVQNFQKLQERRVDLTFGVVYDTSADKLKKIPGIVEKIVEKHKDARFWHTHFVRFDDFALTFEGGYYVQSKDYLYALDTTQDILLAMKKEFEKEKIEFAFPTQTIHIEK